MNVIWITGLSGAGKTTLAQLYVKQLRLKKVPVILLDGDELREIFNNNSNKDHNFSYQERLSLAMRYSLLCKKISSQGFTVVIATISLFQEIFSWNRKNIPGYYEVYLKVPIEILRNRDPKGIYKLYDQGKLKNVAGIDLKVDEPKNPDWLIKYNNKTTIESLVKKLLIKTNYN